MLLLLLLLVSHLTFVLHSRFLFLLLGPHGKGPQYHEIGRSMATLMTDEVRGGNFFFVVVVVVEIQLLVYV